jgi:RNA polymerase sigma factor (sigma-70 family)
VIVSDSVTAPLSFEQFFTEVWPWAFRLACFFTQDAAAGEDIAQDVLARMYRTWGSAERPEAYLRTALVNSCNNWHRRSRTQANKLHLLVGPESVELGATELADAIAHLPFRQRAVIVLRYHSDLSEAEIAEALGCRPGTVKSVAARALDRLAKELPR